ncbi:MAG: rod shape-determining protein MreD [Bacteroidales bacterium]|nr:rod shape-determining protein MreD [Bacteroidales bacterium]
MLKDILITVFQFLILLLCQIFLLNNIQFLGYLNPMLYVWFIIMMPFASPKWLVMICSFLMGLSVDVFSSDIGINACACVFVGFLRPVLLNIFSGNIDNVAFMRPSISSLGFKNFLFFVSSVVLIHHTIYFTAEIFSFDEAVQIILRILFSSCVTILLIILLDMIFFKRKQ